MKLAKIALRLTMLVGALWAVIAYNTHTAPEPLEPYAGVRAADTSPVRSGPPTPPPPPLPTGFPSMERPPPDVEVPEGFPQPIPTKFGWTYDVPGDWRGSPGQIMGWRTGENTVTYGGVGNYGYDYCPEKDGSTLADSGVTGRNNGMDVAAAALDAAHGAEVMFGSSDGPPPQLIYTGPVDMQIAGHPAVRYTVRAIGIQQDFGCDPSESTLDVVAVPGLATAPVTIFMVRLHQNTDGALDHSAADQILSTIRPTPISERRSHGG